jgi:hypothetical protein
MNYRQAAPAGRLALGSIYGVAGVVIAAAVHASTFASVALSPDHSLCWSLQVGVFPLIVLMMWRMRAWLEHTRGTLGFPTSRLRWRELRLHFPRWALTLENILFGYAMVNLFWAMSHLSGASVGAAEEARYTVRAVSGWWMLAYAVATLFFLFVPATPPPTSSRQAAP